MLRKVCLLYALLANIGMAQTILVKKPVSHSLNKSFEIGLGQQFSIMPKFIFHYSPKLDLAFNFNEYLSFRQGLFYNLYRKTTNFSDNLKRTTGFSGELVNYFERTFGTELMFEFSPFYGKVALFDSYIFKLFASFYAGLGLTGLQLHNAPLLNEELDLYKTWSFYGLFGAGIKTLISERFLCHLRVLDIIESLNIKKDSFLKGVVEKDEYLLRHDLQLWLSLGVIL